MSPLLLVIMVVVVVVTDLSEKYWTTVEGMQITRFLRESSPTNPYFKKYLTRDSINLRFSNNISPNLLGLGDFPQNI
jgi:hypothetical protein